MTPPAPHRILFDRQVISARLALLGREIANDLPDPPPIFIGILNGAAQFMLDLIGALPQEIRADLIYDFINLSSYDDRSSQGKVRMTETLAIDIKGRDVLLVDGIADTGHTLRAALDLVAALGCRSVRVCVLLDKPVRRQCSVQLDYVGFTIDDVFVVGYGMDFKHSHRALSYIAAI